MSAVTCRRRRSCWFCDMRTRCCAATSPESGTSRGIGCGSPPCPAYSPGPGGSWSSRSPRPPSCGGTGAWPPAAGTTPTDAGKDARRPRPASGGSSCGWPPTIRCGANAICERLVGTLRRELLGRILIVNEIHLRRVLDEYATHYNGHRLHWARGQRPPDAEHAARPPVTDPATHRVRRAPVLGGLINEYHHAA